MKKVLLLLVLALVVFVMWKASSTKLDLGFMQGKTEVVRRGDLSIPITGTGEIEPKSRSEIKPEASGEVVEITVEAGQMVNANELIIRLDPEDEQRNVTRSTNEVARAKAALDQAELRYEQSKTAALAKLDAQITSIAAQLVEARFKLNKTKDLYKRDFADEDALIQLQSRFDQLRANSNGLQADRQQAEIQIELARRDVILAEKTLESAETSLGDAEERLRETEIRAPIDGMISELSAEVGEVVQGGRTTFTGGTKLAVVADISDMYVRTEVSDADIGAVLWLAPPEARPGGVTLAEELEAGEIPLMVSTAGVGDKINAVGTPVKIMVDSFRDESFEGLIERIYPEPEKVQNIVTYLVDIKVTSPNRKKLALVLGMQADVEFTAQAVENAILIPHDAIRRGPDGNLGVWVEKKVEGSPTPQRQFVKCRFGLDNGLHAELLEGEGITEGTVVYTKLPVSLKDDDDDEDDM